MLSTLLPALALAVTLPGLPLHDCRLAPPTAPTTVAARCGTLEVPEDYARPTGKRLRLAVAVIPALDRNAHATPLFLISGGPGQGARDSFAPLLPTFQRLNRQRDLVLLDQRGTGDSNALTCKEVATDAAALEHTPSATEMAALTQSCLAALSGDPRFYTTSVAVRDLDLVRAALGYSRVNLYGISYGTRVAQHYARRYPAHTRAVIIDGVVPPGLALGPDLAFAAQRAIDTVFSRCEADRACAATYPQLRQQFRALVIALRAGPRPVTLLHPVSGKLVTQALTIDGLGNAVRFLSYNPVSISLLPFLLQEAAAGRPAPLLAQALSLTDTIGGSLAIGMHNAVACTEDLPFMDASAIDHAALANTYLGAQPLEALINSCRVWPRGILDADLRQPLRSNIPFLLLSGGADPVTPPAYAERALRGLSDARHVIVAGNGHGQWNVPCAPRVMAAFLDAGTTRGLDITCLQNAQRAQPFFLNANGPAP